MPGIGEIRRAHQLGRRGAHRYIRVACPDCGRERWVRFIKGKQASLRCFDCHKQRQVSIESSNWKGGRMESRGYVLIRIQPDDFFYPMANDGYIAEHRLVVARALNRCLLPWEIVHHKGTRYPSGSKENRSDNRYPENLQLLKDKKYHLIDSLVKAHIKRQDNLIKELQNRITLLEAEFEIVKHNEPIITAEEVENGI